MKNIILLVVAVILVGAGWYLWPKEKVIAPVLVNNFTECAEAGYPVAESYPRQCRDNIGNLFIENIGNELAKADLIRVDSPRPNTTVKSPLAITGEARGYWFFEASFPIELRDANNQLLVTTIATAQSDWMTENFVPFTATLSYTVATPQMGKLILKKDNPSGLPENDDQLEMPIFLQ